MSMENLHMMIEQCTADDATTDPRIRNEPVLKRTGTPVWAVIGYCLRACDGAVELAAHDYGLTHDEVLAAFAYYQQHPELDVCREGTNRNAAELLSR